MTKGTTMKIHEVFATLRLKNAPAAIEFYKQVFGAVEKFRLVEPSGRVGHCELLFGDTVIMMSEEYPELGFVGPATLGGSSSSIHLHVDDCDAMLAKAVECGATWKRKPSDAFYGERSGVVTDPFGHDWNIGHSIEEVTPEEMQRRYTELMSGPDKPW